MKYEINITSDKWQRKGDSLFFRGYFFDPRHNELVNDIEQVAEMCDYLFSSKEVKLNGIFTIVAKREDELYIYTDTTKLYALWYRNYGDKVVVTDDFYSLTKDATLDKVQENIFKQSGAVLGDDTLFKEIKRISKPIYKYKLNNRRNIETIEKDYHKIIDDSFDRMFCSLKPNQQIVIPLSGGYDSRLITCAVKQKGWTNVLAYTMGKDIEGEQNIAREVAKKLGFKFVQIDFEKVVSKNEAESISYDLEKCIDFVGMGQNFEWIADYYAVKYLHSQNLLDDDAVFVPGFCGDANGGSLHRKLMLDEDATAEHIAKKMLAVRFERGNPLDAVLKNKISEYISSYQCNAMQFFMECHLPSKILNACRVPLYFGYDVRLPFFDQQFLEWCYTIPYRYFKERVIYNEVLEKHYFEPMDVCYKKNETPKSAYIKQYIKSYIKALLPRSFYVKHKHYIDTVQELYLTMGIRRELVAQGKMQDMDDYLSVNEVMSKYLFLKLARLTRPRESKN